MKEISRRDFLKITGAAVSFLGALELAPEETITAVSSSPQVKPLGFEVSPNDDLILRMQSDLQRALEKPVEQRRWVMVIDLRKCIGCSACTIACVAENKLPPGVVYRPVMTEEFGTYPNVALRFLPRPCMQCDEPPCVPVCPVAATYKDENGVVVIDYDRCIGCRYCVPACPYSARTFDFGALYTDETAEFEGIIFGKPSAAAYEQSANYEYSEVRARTDRSSSPIGNVRKCHFCLHRLKEGMLPACTTTCIGRATYFGDANDSDSLVADLIASPNVMRLKEDLGTQPRVYYLT